jgi:hypothetical protein
MGPHLKVKIQMLKEIKLELLGQAIRGFDVARELEHIEEKLNKHGRMLHKRGRMLRENRKNRKKIK